jgi:hypothetical protein
MSPSSSVFLFSPYCQSASPVFLGEFWKIKLPSRHTFCVPTWSIVQSWYHDIKTSFGSISNMFYYNLCIKNLPPCSPTRRSIFVAALLHGIDKSIKDNVSFCHSLSIPTTITCSTKVIVGLWYYDWAHHARFAHLYIVVVATSCPWSSFLIDQICANMFALFGVTDALTYLPCHIPSHGGSCPCVTHKLAQYIPCIPKKGSQATLAIS